MALGIGSAGGLLGAVVSTAAADRFGAGRTLLASIAVFSAGAAMVPLATGAVGFIAALFVVYLGVVVFNILQMTICQTTTPTHLLGRMNATLRFLSWGAVPLGAAPAAALISPLGLRGCCGSLPRSVPVGRAAAVLEGPRAAPGRGGPCCRSDGARGGERRMSEDMIGTEIEAA
ncbi:hypothetical protein [Streptomyces sp. NPDC050422]|uniref:hypothetical protein n=1 Tax=Streptomyces sp. NPDC050422 TaxID=3365614 RepID=UPI003799E318